MYCTKTTETHYPADLGLSDKGRTIEGIVVWNSLDVIALGPAKMHVLFQPFPEV